MLIPQQEEPEYISSSELLDMVYDHDDGEERFLALVQELLGRTYVFDEENVAYHLR
jgi:hypothetical protein